MHATIFAIENGSAMDLRSGVMLELISALTALVPPSRRSSAVTHKAYLESGIYENTARTWHDLIMGLRSSQPEGFTQCMPTARALEAWRQYSLRCGLKENADVYNLRKPSGPNVNSQYLNFPKKCFWNASPYSVFYHGGIPSDMGMRGMFPCVIRGKMCQEEGLGS
ncbi:hypothetical protein BXZ70DRAFT_935591 [Cristinia sonorae]|uniref:Uncharacterized protein n=1 Tax=Cristinia sonorae TaxID=1940300 RepID=A0A8K0UQN5_9AGAR|nr:hypothetical protein BXZ70DRAFT_935591 [Cristinia sonorae]